MKKNWTSLVAAVTAVSLLSTTGVFAATKSVTVHHESAKKNGFTVALSNSFIGNNWRAQMESDIQAKINQYKKSGLVTNYYVANAGNSVSTQISQIQDMIQRHPDLLLVDAASSVALNPVIKKAESQGITVVSFDNTVTDPQAMKVSVDFSSYGKIAGNWLAKTLHGKGDIVAIRGVPGSPVDAQIYNAAAAVLAKYKGIHIVKQIYGSWDEASAQSQMSSFLATGQKVNGVLTEGGEAYGVVQALQNVHHPLVPVVGGGTVSFLRFWSQHIHAKGFNAISIGNPPALGSYALDIGLLKLTGTKVPNSIFMPLPVVTPTNLKKYLNQPPANRFDVQLSMAQVKAVVLKQK